MCVVVLSILNVSLFLSVYYVGASAGVTPEEVHTSEFVFVCFGEGRGNEDKPSPPPPHPREPLAREQTP